MNDLESTFSQLLGRQATEAEMIRLHRVKDALNLSDNDSLWLILMAFESYDTLYSKYPAMIQASLAEMVSSQRQVLAGLAEAETRKAVTGLTEAVNKTSQELAGRWSQASQLLAWGWSLSALVLFGALCVMVGFVLGSGQLPPWGYRGGNLGLTLLVTLARTPAGWIAGLFGLGGLGWALWKRRERPQELPLAWILGGLSLFGISLLFLIIG